jgi:hypothetical protein
MTPAWTYKVPVLRQSRWANLSGPLTSTDLEWPRVGVYCDAPSHESIWLVGSFVVGEAGWRWESKYPTGDGHLIHLHWDANKDSDTDPSTQFLVDDRPHDPEADAAALESAVDSGDYDEMRRVLDEQDRARAVMRSRPVLECKSCGDRVIARADRVNAALQMIWAGGVREISLNAARRRLARASGDAARL